MRRLWVVLCDCERRDVQLHERVDWGLGNQVQHLPVCHAGVQWTWHMLCDAGLVDRLHVHVHFALWRNHVQRGHYGPVRVNDVHWAQLLHSSEQRCDMPVYRRLYRQWVHDCSGEQRPVYGGRSVQRPRIVRSIRLGHGDVLVQQWVVGHEVPDERAVLVAQLQWPRDVRVRIRRYAVLRVYEFLHGGELRDAASEPVRDESVLERGGVQR